MTSSIDKKPSINDVFKVIDKATEKLGNIDEIDNCKTLFYQAIEIQRWKNSDLELTLNERWEVIVMSKKWYKDTQVSLFELLTSIEFFNKIKSQHQIKEQ